MFLFTDERLYKERVQLAEMNNPARQVAITEDIRIIIEMEAAVGYSARSPNGQKWINPVAKLAFYLEVRDNIPKLLQYSRRQKRSVESGIAEYERNMQRMLNKMSKLAIELDSIIRDFGVAETVIGGVTIATGAIGIILTPFTGGASLALTGSAIGIAAGVAGLAGWKNRL